MAKRLTEPRVYGIVGDGRVARHTSHYLSLSGLPTRSWSRRSGGELGSVLEDATVVLLLISDGAIQGFADENAHFLSDRMPVHFSGCVSHPRVSGMHPLSTFGPALYDLETYAAIPFVCEDEGVSFQDAFPDLRNRSFVIPRASKPLYHAAAVLAGNFSTALWLKLFEVLESMDLPRDAAWVYLERTCHNLVEHAEADVLTGPVARGDARTVQANLEALSGDPYAAVYRAFVETLAPELL